MLHEYFYKIDKRIDDEKIYNYKAKSFSRILQDYENQILMNLYDCFSFRKIKMMSLIFDGMLLLPKRSINIHDIENYLYNKSNIPMKITIKAFECHYKRFGESNVDMNEFKRNIKINVILIKKSYITTILKNSITLLITFVIIVT